MSRKSSPSARATLPRRATLAKRAAATFVVSKASFQLATLVSQPPRGAEWVYERKLDGYRAMADLRRKGHLVFISRNGLSFVEQFPAIARALSAMRSLGGAVVDGEIVAYDGDTISFHAMQLARQPGTKGRLEYMVFDLLAAGGQDLRDLPLLERRARLLELVPKEGIVRAIGYTTDADEALAGARALHDEGIIAKLADAPYRAERSLGWQKIKITTEDDFVVVGWTPSKHGPGAIGSLALATRERKGGPLVYAGRVGTGFALALRGELAARLGRRRASSRPLEVPRDAARGMSWTEPRMVVRVGYLSYTSDGVLRHPTFRGERRDLAAADVARERPLAGS